MRHTDPGNRSLRTGGAGAKTPVSGIGVAHPAEAVMLTLRQVEMIGDDLMLRYSVD